MRKVHFYKNFLMALVVAAACQMSFGQVQQFKKGVANFEKGFYQLAINDFSKIKTADSSQATQVAHYIAESYRLTNRWTEAVAYYERAIGGGHPNPDALFYYAYGLKALADYPRALAAFQRFSEAKSANKLLNERALREINTLKILDEVAADTSQIVFQNLKKVNSAKTEFGPVVYQGKLVFTASRKDRIYTNGLPFLGIYSQKLDEDGTPLGEATLFSTAIFDPERNEGSTAFSPDGKIVVFARGNSGKRKDLSPDVDLYTSRLQPDGSWSEPRWVSASDSASWDGSPAFSRNGNVLYFASNRAGGNGGIDIYSVNLDASGRFGTPRNMGRPINSVGDDMFPFVSADGKLYFSSDGHPGLGKLDLFVAVRSGGKTEVKNLGLPYNSSMDDFGLFIDDRGNQYFSSNRLGGQGDDDIYFYESPEVPAEPIASKPATPTTADGKTPDIKQVNYFLIGTITGSEGSRASALDSAKVRIVRYADGVEETLHELYTTREGRYGPVRLEVDTDYGVVAEKKDYLTKREGFSMYGRGIPQRLLTKPITDTTFVVDVPLQKIFIGRTFTLENIYYDLDKADIRPDAAVELDKLVQILQDNPLIKIELGSHTDTRGSDMYNLRLSQRRAESAVNYIVSKGIDRERITARGYGETLLIIEEAKTEEEHQRNRRTEFKVLEINAQPANTLD